MYVSPPMSSELRTGSIIKVKNSGSFAIVLSPPCDLVIRQNGECKTDKILICDIGDFDVVKDDILGDTKAQKKAGRLEKLLKNNETEYYHWLPQASSFQGGIVNFRWVSSLSLEQIRADFDKPLVQVAAPYIKDLLSRFSAYYARQGQPDFNTRQIAANLVVRYYNI